MDGGLARRPLRKTLRGDIDHLMIIIPPASPSNDLKRSVYQAKSGCPFEIVRDVEGGNKSWPHFAPITAQSELWEGSIARMTNPLNLSLDHRSL